MQKNRFLSLLAACAVALGAVSLAMADKEKGEKKEQ